MFIIDTRVRYSIDARETGNTIEEAQRTVRTEVESGSVADSEPPTIELQTKYRALASEQRQL